MKKWYQWFYLAAVWIVAGVVNYFAGRDNYYLFQILLFLALAPCQFVCEKYGEKGKRIFRCICIGVVALCIVYIGAVISSVLR